ncbi:hypothetical protein [Henriciella mobilis]|uniref:Uncharacterized protein n=1 Tax=Henriciella mobilis TaxID=2305467 RepID=A0A399RNW1_9PROT|nr:hypothetical protein [Henriciella mobilis]RIJ32888.1 hypothetical protein D1223_03310 [Henriciella mobilis]
MKTPALLSSALFLGACCMTGMPMAEDGDPDAAGDLCGFAIKDVSAWRNQMPGPDGPSGNLVIVIEIEADEISRRFQSGGISENGTLLLDIVEWDHPSGIGKIVYRKKSVPAERVEIRCGGEIVTTIDKIDTVY